jgi:hypothetical protein
MHACMEAHGMRISPAASPLHTCLHVQCAFSPVDGSIVSVVGHGIFKMFKLIDGSLKLLNVALGKRDHTSIISQQWISVEGPGGGGDSKERLLLGTSDGEIVMLEVWQGWRGLEKRGGEGRGGEGRGVIAVVAEGDSEGRAFDIKNIVVQGTCQSL